MKKAIAPFLFLILTLLLTCPVFGADTARMNASSVTLVKGETYKLKALQGEAAVSASSWKSDNKNVASVSSSGKVTAKARGSATISAVVSGKTVKCLVSVVSKTDSTSIRYSVLIMDTSASMRGSPLRYAKSAAKKFVKTLLDADGRNYVAIVTLNSDPETVCSFSNKKSVLNKQINKLKASGHTNMEAALAKAGKLLKNVPSGKKITKNIVLLSDGLPESGKRKKSGRYTSSDHKNYKYANATYATDKSLKKKYFVYALGFFHKSSSKDLKFGRKLMKDLASKDKYYVVTDKSDISDKMEEIAKTITKVEINKSTATMYVGDTLQLKLFTNGSAVDGTWSSGKTQIAEVSKTGLVTAKAVGKVTITGTFKNASASCVITVKARPHRYKVYEPEEGVTREEAAALCSEMGGYLVSINSEEEQKVVEELLTDPQKYSYWLGGVKQADGTWKWDDGTAVTYVNWDTGAQEGTGPDDEKYMGFVGIRRSGTYKSFGEWLDTYNEGYGSAYNGHYKTEHFGFICEWDS